MAVWKLVVKTWSLERKHRGSHTSAVPRELAQENVNVARIKFCRRRSEQHQRGPAACKLPCSCDQESGQQTSPCSGRYTRFIKMHSSICHEFSMSMAYLGTGESKQAPSEVSRGQTLIYLGPRVMRPCLYLTLFDLVCWGWLEEGHGEPHHTGVGLPAVSRILSPIKDSRLCLINWTQHG